MAKRVKVWGHLDIDDELVDPNHPSGLTQAGFERVQKVLAGFDDIDSEVVDD